MSVTAIPVMEFLNQGYKIRKIFPKNQHTQMKLLNLKNWCNEKVSKLGIILEYKVI